MCKLKGDGIIPNKSGVDGTEALNCHGTEIRWQDKCEGYNRILPVHGGVGGFLKKSTYLDRFELPSI